MHVSSTKALVPEAHAISAAPRPGRSTLWTELVVLIPMTIVLTLLASLATAAIVVLDPNLVWIMPG